MNDLNERMAATVVAHFEDGAFEQQDIGGGSSSVHDYDILTTDGRTIALEVTQLMRENIAAQRDCERRYEWRFPSLTRAWEIKVPGVVDISELHEVLPDILKRLELILVDQVLGEYVLIYVAQMYDRSSPLSRDLIDNYNQQIADDTTNWDPRGLLIELGLQDATLACRDASTDQSGEVKIRTLVGMGGFVSHSGVLAREIIPIAAKKSRQLTCAVADERHLFVWISHDVPDVYVALCDEDVELPGLELDKSVDTLWLAIHNYPPMVWRYDKLCTTWTYMTMPSASAEELELKLTALHSSAGQEQRRRQRETIEALNRLSRLLFPQSFPPDGS